MEADDPLTASKDNRNQRHIGWAALVAVILSTVGTKSRGHEIGVGILVCELAAIGEGSQGRRSRYLFPILTGKLVAEIGPFVVLARQM